MATLAQDDTRRWWMNPNSFGTVLLALALDRWGTDAMSFEPETIRLELREAFGQDIPQINMDKLMAMIAALTTNLFYVSVETFSHVCDALSHHEPNFQVMEPPEPEELAWGVAEITLNDGTQGIKEKGPLQYSHEVRRFIGISLKQYGIRQPPPILSLAEMDESPNYMSDDPAMVAAFYTGQRRDSEELTQFVKEQTRALVAQLQAVPLQNRDSNTWQQFAAKAQSRLGPLIASEPPASP